MLEMKHFVAAAKVLLARLDEIGEDDVSPQADEQRTTIAYDALEMITTLVHHYDAQENS